MIVAGSVQLTGRSVHLEEVPAPTLNRDYECANAKLSTTLGFIPRRSVLEAVSDLLTRIDGESLVRPYRPALLQHPLAGAAPRGQATA